MSVRETWVAVDDYYADLYGVSDPALDECLAASRRAGLPPIAVSPLQGRLLHLLALAAGARRILEVGTLGGYSAIWLARALPADGRLVTLEYSPEHAAVARASLERAGLGDRTEVVVGDAAETLPRLAASGTEPFDLVFLDADKEGYPAYLDAALRITRPGSLIVADNVVREGAVVDGASTDTMVQGIRRFNERVAAEPRLCATAIQTVGSKGYDGFTLARVQEA